MVFRVIQRFTMLNFNALTEVYKESIDQECRQNFPDLSSAEQQAEGRQDLYNYLRNVFFKTENALCFVLEEDGMYFCAARIEPYKDGLLLEAIETAPQYRRKGYARSLLTQIIEHVQKMELPLYAHIFKNNTASVLLHLSCGFVQVEDHAVFIDGSVSHLAQTYCYQKHPEN